MSAGVTIIPGYKLALVELSGPVDDVSLLQALDSVYLDDAWHPSYDVIWDGRGIDKLVVDPRGSRRIAQRVQDYASRIGTGRTAIVGHRQMDREFAEMVFARLRCLSHRYKVCASIDTALLWIKGVEGALRWKMQASAVPDGTASQFSSPSKAPARPPSTVQRRPETADPHAVLNP